MHERKRKEKKTPKKGYPHRTTLARLKNLHRGRTQQPSSWLDSETFIVAGLSNLVATRLKNLRRSQTQKPSSWPDSETFIAAGQGHPRRDSRRGQAAQLSTRPDKATLVATLVAAGQSYPRHTIVAGRSYPRRATLAVLRWLNKPTLVALPQPTVPCLHLQLQHLPLGAPSTARLLRLRTAASPVLPSSAVEGLDQPFRPLRQRS